MRKGSTKNKSATTKAITLALVCLLFIFVFSAALIGMLDGGSSFNGLLGDNSANVAEGLSSDVASHSTNVYWKDAADSPEISVSRQAQYWDNKVTPPNTSFYSGTETVGYNVTSEMKNYSLTVGNAVHAIKLNDFSATGITISYKVKLYTDRTTYLLNSYVRSGAGISFSTNNSSYSWVNTSDGGFDEFREDTGGQDMWYNSQNSDTKETSLLSGSFSGNYAPGTVLYLRFTSGWYAEKNRAIKVGSWAQLSELKIQFTGVTTNVNVNSEGSGSITNGGLHTFSKMSDSFASTATPNDGHYFSGWYNNNNLVSSQNTYTFNGNSIIANSTYTAKFLPGYTLKFNANGGSGSMPNQPCIPSQATTINSVSGFSRAGYYFAGWATSAGGGVAYTNSATIPANTYAELQIVNLYAVWRPINYTIVYNRNGGNTAATMPGNITGAYANSSIALDARDFSDGTNYTFLGWFGAASGGSRITAVTAAMLTNAQGGNLLATSVTVTVYAHWVNSDFGRDVNSSAKWGSEANPYLIKNLTHLNNLSAIAAGTRTASDSLTGSAGATYTNPQGSARTFNGCYFKVTAGFSVGNFVPIGPNAYKFEGNFDGDNFTLSNMTVTSGADGASYLGLFGNIEGATVKNVKLTNVNISGAATSHGGIAGTSRNSTIENCSVSGTISGTHQIGGIVGFVAQGNSNVTTVKNCVNSATVSGSEKSSDNNRSSIGGIVGYVGGGGVLEITGCSNSGTISCSDTAGAGIGGIVGYTNSPTVTVSGCSNSGGVTAGTKVGGIVGYLYGAAGTGGTLKNSSNSGTISGGDYTGGIGGLLQDTRLEGTFVNNGTISSSGSSVGGIAGKFWGGSNVAGTTLTNNKSVSGVNNVGGIAGQIEYGVIPSSTNTGAVTGSGTTVGGILGWLNASGALNGTYLNSGNIRGGSNVGGIGGNLNSASSQTLTGSINTGSVTVPSSGSDAYCGGIAGNSANVAITRCFNSGYIKKEAQGSANYIGGIVGNTNSVVSYCYNGGGVWGSHYLGGIAGATSSDINNCYNDAKVENQWNDGGARVGTISGSGSGNYTWDLPNSSLLNAGYSGTKLYAVHKLDTALNYYPIFGNSAPYTVENSKSTILENWKSVATYGSNVKGFAVAASIANGYYFKSTSDNASAYLTPNAGIESNHYNTDTDTATPISVTGKYLASTSSNVFVASEAFTVSVSGAGKTYDGKPLSSTNSKGFTATTSPYSANYTYYIGSLGGTVVSSTINAATYYIKTDIVLNGVLVGRRTNTTATINKYNVTNATITYKGISSHPNDSFTLTNGQNVAYLLYTYGLDAAGFGGFFSGTNGQNLLTVNCGGILTDILSGKDTGGNSIGTISFILSANGVNATATVTLNVNGSTNFAGALSFTAFLMDHDFGGYVSNGWGGSAANPYIVSNDNHFVRLSQIVNGEDAPWDSVKGQGYTALSSAASGTTIGFLNGNFRQDANLTVNRTVGGYFNSSSHSFGGVYEGNSKAIIANISGTNHTGVFGYVDGTVKNLTVEGTITSTGAGEYTGVIAEATSNSLISNVTNNANITASGNYTGGIVGIMHSTAKIENCTNNGNVTGTSDVGGIVGRAGAVAAGAKISDCTNNGTVKGSGSNVGGILGIVFNGNAVLELSACQNTAKVESTGGGNVGGIVGCSHNQISLLTLKGKFVNDGVVTATGDNVGGIIGSGYHLSIQNDTVNSVNAQYENTAFVSGNSYVGGIFGYFVNSGTQTFSATSATVNGIQGGDGVRANFAAGGIFGYLGGSGTVKGVLTSDGGDIDNETGSNYLIGGIAGILDGVVLGSKDSGNSIISKSRVIARGFGDFTHNGVTYSGALAGGVVGLNINGKIINALRPEADVISVAKRDYVGGIVGYSDGGEISACSVQTSAFVGIVINGTTLYAQDYVGGIAGYSSANIMNCFNGAVVGGRNNVGGIAGYSSASISYCASTAQISGTADYTGGIAGVSTNWVKFSYYFASLTNYVPGAGALAPVGNSTGSVYSAYTFTTSLDAPVANATLNGAYVIVPSGSTVKPVLNGGFVDGVKWDDISAKNYNGFRIAVAPFANGKYLDMSNGGASVNTATRKYIAPDAIDVSAGITTDYNLKVSGDARASSHIVLQIKDIDIVSASKPYNRESIRINDSHLTKKADGTLALNNDFFDYISALYGEYDWDSSGYMSFADSYFLQNGDALNGLPVNAGIYGVKIEIKALVGGQLFKVGQTLDVELEIAQARIDTVGEPVYLGYAGTTSNSALSTYVNSFGLLAKIMKGSTSVYALNQNLGYGYLPTSIVLKDAYYDWANFVVRHYEYGLSKGDLLAGQDFIVKLTDGTVICQIVDGSLVLGELPGENDTDFYDKDVTLIFEGTGNYAGTVKLSYMIVDGDFGVLGKDAAEKQNNKANAATPWGSKENPYLISNWVHLMRLCMIVNNESAPWDSITGQGLLIGTDTKTACNSQNFKGGYFALVADISLDKVKVGDEVKRLLDRLSLSAAAGTATGTSNGAAIDASALGKLFDGKIYGVDGNIDALQGTGQLEFTFDMGVEVYCAGFAWTTGNVDYLVGEGESAVRKSRNFVYTAIFGSDNGTNWTKFHEIGDELPADSGARKAFYFSGVSYRYFKVVAYAKDKAEYQAAEFELLTAFKPIGNGTGANFAGTLFGNKSFALNADNSVDYGTLVNNDEYGKLNKITAVVSGVDCTGLFGYTVGASFVSFAFGGEVYGKKYTGGIVGYAENTNFGTAEFSNVGGNTVYFDGVTVDATVSGTDYVGALAGYIVSTGTELYTYSDFIVSGDISGNDYVGGIAGAAGGVVMDDGTEESVKINVHNPTFDNATIKGVNYIGTLFGKLVGQAYAANTAGSQGETAATADGESAASELLGWDKNYDYDMGEADLDAVNLVSFGSAQLSSTLISSADGQYIGGLVGYMSNAALFSINTVFDTKNIAKGVTLNGKDYVGGVIGYLGFNGAIVGSSATQNVLQNSITVTGNGNYIGGIIGAIENGAGAVDNSRADAYVVGANVQYVNIGEIKGANRVGGLIGGSVDSVKNSKTTFEPDKAYNLANVSVVGDYAGGLVGSTTSKVFLVFNGLAAGDKQLVNFGRGASSEERIYNGNISGATVNVSGNSYVGGIVGYMAALGDQGGSIQYVFNTAKVSGSDNVGGIAGYMENGTVTNCFVTSVSEISQFTDMISGTNYVGGIVGNLESGSVQNCYTQGFKFTSVGPTKGGIIGGTVRGSFQYNWTVYVASSPDFKTVSTNSIDTDTNGRYVIIDSLVATLMNISEIADYAGLLFSLDVTPPDAESELSNPTAYALRASERDLGGLNGEKGHLSFASSINEINGSQIVFYDVKTSPASTNGITSKNAFVMGEKNDVVFTKLLASTGTAASFSICVKDIELKSIGTLPEALSPNDTYTENTLTDATYKAEILNSYLKPGESDTRYYIKHFAADFDPSRSLLTIQGDIYYKYDGVNDVLVGHFYNDYSATSGDVLVIRTQKEWNAFAKKLHDGAETNSAATGEDKYGYKGMTVKLMTNVSVQPTDGFSNNDGNSFAGNLSYGGSALTTEQKRSSFQGIFEGNQHTITVQYSNTASMGRVSVFPNASDATFQNLTIKGTINVSNGYDIAAFVGKPFGNLNFRNCTSDVAISALRLAAGMAAYTQNYKISCIDCTNTGAITTSEYVGSTTNYEHGTGGIIASVTNDTVIESCRNTGAITGGNNVGGIVGRTSAQLTIKNCANTGFIKSTHFGYNVWSCVGGLLGTTGKTGALFCYGSYNSGTVQAAANMAGGIVGSLGEYTCRYFVMGATTRNEKVESDHKSVIAYSYNSGQVRTGGQAVVSRKAAWISDEQIGGTQCGGLVGLAANIDILNCYNVGDAVSYGQVGYSYSWQVRVGGLIGQAHPTSGQTINVQHCYSVGRVIITVQDGDARYGAGIVGYIDSEVALQNTTISKDTYTLRNNVMYGTYDCNNDTLSSGTKYFAEWNETDGLVGSASEEWVKPGTVLDSLTDFTGVYVENDGAGVGTHDRVVSGYSAKNTETLFNETYKSSAESLVGENGTELSALNADGYSDPTDNADYKNGTLNGWIYLYGCLPQLAIFALDTENGLSMHSVKYSKNDKGEYVLQKAGDRFSPYIIKDGIDLSGLSALVYAQNGNYFWNGKAKYIAFANSTNNYTSQDGKFHADVSAYINMPDASIAKEDYFKYSDTADGAAKLKGRSYHLYEEGALVAKNPNSGTDLLDEWSARNWYFKNGVWATGAKLTDVNFYPIGVYGKYRYFGGTITGLQTDGSNSEIRNLKVDYTDPNTAYAGLFGRVQDASIANITVTGSVTGRLTDEKGGASYTGGIVGYTGGHTTISGCQVGKPGQALKVTAESFAGNKNTSAESNTGGIVGRASTIVFDNTTKNGKIDFVGEETRYSFSPGSRLDVNDCVSYADVTGFKSFVGGVLGYATATYGNLDNGETTYISVSGCAVREGTLRVSRSSVTGTVVLAGDETTGSRIGGVGGGGDGKVIYTVSNCEVGTAGVEIPVASEAAAKVKIYGENSVGGVIAQASGNTTVLGSCVFGDVYMKRRSADGKSGIINTDTTTTNNQAGDIKFGVAFGGIIGFTNGKCIIRNFIDTTTIPDTNIPTRFFGVIDVSVAAQTVDKFDNTLISNIGGIIGCMSEGASIDRGDINFGGRISATQNNTEDVGGIVGLCGSETSFTGTYKVSPNIDAKHATNVGGFIGRNLGVSNIYRNNSDGINVKIEIGDKNADTHGTISGYKNVGGFIGNNAAGATFNIGNLQTASNTGGSVSIQNYAYAEGAIAVGGIVGRNDGTINIVQGTITNSGNVGTGADSKGPANTDQDNSNSFYGGIIGMLSGGSQLTIGSKSGDNVTVARLTNTGITGNTGNYQYFVGGTIGVSYSTFTIYSGSMNNEGEVDGYFYVGGSIGMLDTGGELIGEFTNNGTVKGHRFVGGVIGMVGGGITGDNTVNGGKIVAVDSDTLFNNNGTVIGYNTIDAAGKAVASRYVGGSIGAMLGTISGNNAGNKYVRFTNQGTVIGTEYSGGNIGALAGSVDTVQFINAGKLMFSNGVLPDTYVSKGEIVISRPADDALYSALGGVALGGSIGAISDNLPDGDLGSRKTSVSNTHSEYSNADLNAMNVVSTSAAPVNNSIGGVGGVIGLIDAQASLTDKNAWDKNTFYVSGNVTARQALNVGGVVGYIKDVYVTIKNMLAYDTTVTGYDNVGGIVGNNQSTNVNSAVNEADGTYPSLYNCFNITLTESNNGVVGTKKGATLGGIVGLAKAGTYAVGCYWVKGFKNDSLANCDIRNLGSTLGATYQVVKVTVDVADPISGAVTKQEVSLTAEYCEQNPKPVIDGQPYDSWDIYFQQIDSKAFKNAYGDWIEAGEMETVYTTGNERTGWYYVFASDAIVTAGATEDVNTVHSKTKAENLAYWKWIAQAYAAAEQNRIPTEFKSQLVYTEDVGATSGSAQPGHIYATATTGNKNGFYLYMRQSGSEGLTTNYKDGLTADGTAVSRFHIDADASTANNVLVFYKQALVQNSIVYNGVERYAPFKDRSTLNYYEGTINEAQALAAKWQNKYVYTLEKIENETVNYGVNVGTYDTDAVIYYVDSKGMAHAVGTARSKDDAGNLADENLRWKITARPLTERASIVGGQFTNNLADRYIEFVITSVAEADIDDIDTALKFNIKKGNDSLGNAVTVTAWPSALAAGTIYRKKGLSATASTSDNLYNVNNCSLYDLLYRVYYLDAATYAFTISMPATPDVPQKNYSFSDKKEELVISRRQLTVALATGSTSGYEYDGAAHSMDISVTGWANGETASVKQSAVTYFGLKYTSVKGKIAQLGTFNTSTNRVTVSATNADVYKFSFTNGTYGNYELKNKDYVVTLTITKNVFAVEWKDAPSEYNSDVKTGSVTVTANKAFGSEEIWKAIVAEFKAAIGGTGTVGSFTYAGNSTVTITFNYGKNVGTYTASLTNPSLGGEDYGFETDSGDKVTHNFIITKATLELNTINWTSGGGSGHVYVYNTSHQGLDNITLTGLKGTDTLSTAVNVTGGKVSNNVIKPNDTINYGNYSLSIAAKSNYQFAGGNPDAFTWQIEKFGIEFGAITGIDDFTYDGTIHTASATLKTGDGVTGAAGNYTFYNDKITTVVQNASICNAGTYNLSAGTIKAERAGMDTTDNYKIEKTASSLTITVSQRAVTVTGWNSADAFVYDKHMHGRMISEISLNGLATRTPTLINVNVASVQGCASGETLTFTISGWETDAGESYNAFVASNGMSVSGNNEAGATALGNYSFTSTQNQDYKIVKSQISFNTSGVLSKIYDATTSLTLPSGFSYTLNSSNGGAAGSAQDVLSIIAVFDNKNAGSNKTLTFTVTLNGDSVLNYDLTNPTSEFAIGLITQAELTVSLNLRSGRAVKTYNGTNEFASAVYAGGTSLKSKIFRSGQGFEVTGFPSAESAGEISFAAVFAEAGKDRKSFDSYVNNAYKDTNGNYIISKNTTYYKQLVFSMSGIGQGNYRFLISGFHSALSDDSATLIVYDSSDKDSSHTNDQGASAISVVIEKKTLTATYENTSQSYATQNNTYNTDWLRVVGTLSGVAQSDTDKLSVNVSNGWMYESGKDEGVGVVPNQKYYKYTSIGGKSGNEELGAALAGTDGVNLNYTLRNQPSLVIGYFVETTGDVYEISTFAGLMLATYYYASNFTGGLTGGSSTKIVWSTLCTQEQYDNNADIPVLNGISYDDWDAYFAAFVAVYNADPSHISEISVVRNDELDAYGYYEEVIDSVTKYLNFIQTANLSGRLTDMDISLLVGQFGDDWGFGKANLTNFFKTASGSVVSVIGSIFPNVKVTLDGKTVKYPFIGTYDGNGYIIDTVNISAVITKSVDVGGMGAGMFESVSSETMPGETVPRGGKVTGVNLRNFNISVVDYSGVANVLYVGGIVAYNQQNGAIENSSFHGSISVDAPSSTVYVGGIVGCDVWRENGNKLSIDGAVVLGSFDLTANTLYAGGIVGAIDGVGQNFGYIQNVVSMAVMSFKAATSNTGGLIGFVTNEATASAAKYILSDGLFENAYLKGSIVNLADGSTIVKAIFNGSADALAKTYSDLRKGTVSGYDDQGIYLRYVGITPPAAGKYDVLEDENKQLIVNGNTQTSPYESMRLGDMIDVYMLLYGKTIATVQVKPDAGKEETISVTAFKKASSSTLVGTATGTDDNRIGIAYQQHLGLLAMFRFASFDLNNDVKMYVSYDGAPYSGAFFGSVNVKTDGSGNRYTIDLGPGHNKLFEYELSALPIKQR